MDPAADFREAYRAWREAPFPPTGRGDDLSLLHAELALYDTWVADSVIPFVEHGRYKPAVPDVLGEVARMIEAAQGFSTRATPDDRSVAQQYVAYARVLEAAYRGFLAVPSRDIHQR